VEMGVMTEEEAAKSPLRHILTRNLGSAENVDPEVFEIVPSGSDRSAATPQSQRESAVDIEPGHRLHRAHHLRHVSIPAGPG